jgi:hypothetical protein
MAADKTIEQLIAATALQLTDDGVIVQNGVTKKSQVQLYIDLIGAALSLGSLITFGTTIPTGGKDTDVYLKTDTNQLYQRVSGTWGIKYTFPSGSGTTVLFASGIPSSGTGNNGDTYIDTGTGIFYKKTTGTWAQVFSMATGPAGPRGNSILNGSVDPSSGTGVNGDFYINTTSFKIFGPKTAGAWGSGTLLLIIPNTLRSGNTNPSNGLGIDGDFYINYGNWTMFGPKGLITTGVWPTGVVLTLSLITPVTLNYAKGTALPIVLTSFQTLYSEFGEAPKFSCVKTTGGYGVAALTTPATSASNGTFTNQNIVATLGVGTGGKATFIVFGGFVTSVVKTVEGSGFAIGDTFTSTVVAGAVFTITNLTINTSDQDLTSSATILIGRIAGLPDNISINVDDDGTGHLNDNIDIIIST